MKLQGVSALALLVSLTGLPGPSLAGTLCGTVRDALTNGPVDGAGVFVFHPGGSYAGHVAVTDAAGAFCIGDIPAGVYDLQIRVDDYVEKVVSGVVVSDDVSGVDVALGTRIRLAPPYPNPARGRVLLSFELAAPTEVTLEVFDVAGRLIQGWQSGNLSAGTHEVDWAFTSRDGQRTAPGIYLVRLTSPHAQLTRRVVYLGS